jgi:hypothetical protein
MTGLRKQATAGALQRSWQVLHGALVQLDEVQPYLR